MAKMFDGKKVYDRESFSYELAKIGDYVTEEVVDDAINCLPPASMTAHCSQMGRADQRPFRPGQPPLAGNLRNLHEGG